ncbi:Protein FAR1-RELATED SEQUENCE 5 [Rhynchospora pubera]|uniref:Protein FAR1-RELATED SEQUENCE n=1 Tax=Rhynchospora pubera TaxID=906938 RepID=A0AAV8BTE7_9POAL|nr:Protein FAR1-RELATED SEQUENCE 5 [Rhynchospora pubera]
METDQEMEQNDHQIIRTNGVNGPTKCRQCGLSSILTSHMRSGPEGRRTLCNACGIAWRKGKLRKLVAYENAARDPESSRPVPPEIEMEFENEDKAYEFYNKYAGLTGFSVRKGWIGKTSAKMIRSVTLVCSREGFKKDKKGYGEVKRPKPDTRIGCLARLTIKRTPSGAYRVKEFIAEHNHPLAPSSALHLLRSQRVLSNSGNASAPDPYDEPAEFTRSLNFFPPSFRMSLRSKRTRDMQSGDAEAIMNYLQSMRCNDPSFFSAFQLDEDDRLTNVFWVDAKSIQNFKYFGDVVCLDTSYKSNGYSRPVVPFLGLNHHRQVIIFGAALLYDETADSFGWLLETFKTAMHGDKPKVIVTDRAVEISDAVSAVWPGTCHLVCPWQVHQSMVKSLGSIIQSNRGFLKEFTRCIYDIENEHEFVSAWQEMLERFNIRQNEWLSALFVERERWAQGYVRHIFCADVTSALRTCSLTNFLKRYLCVQIDLLTFFKHYEQMLDEQRFLELQADFRATQSAVRVLPSKMLRQAAESYTPAVYEIFKREFEVFLDCMLYNSMESGTVAEYRIVEGSSFKEYYVRVDSSDWSAVCTCRKFEFVGIQCGHVLKVLDVCNIKEVPERYFLKRWRRDAKSGGGKEDDKSEAAA